MKTKLLLLISIVLFYVNPINAQQMEIPEQLNIPVNDPLKEEILNGLETLFTQIEAGELQDKWIEPENFELNKYILESFKGETNHSSDSIDHYYQKQLINFYETGPNQYLLSIAYLSPPTATNTELKLILNLLAHKKPNKEDITFSTPLQYHTKYWQSRTIGNVRYIYRNKLNEDIAKEFDRRNTIIANKMGQEPENLDFYMCQNYQEAIQLVGYEYEKLSNGKSNNGLGVVGGNVIFSITHNEDFSHDIFHFYSGKINERKNRNWITEEGIAYSWGNAYYVDAQGQMVEQAQLIAELKKHLAAHPETDLFELFENRPKIFQHINSKFSIRSTLSSLICDEVERQKGMEGINQLINCGRENSLEDYLKATDELVAINRKNFHKKVMKLIEGYGS